MKNADMPSMPVRGATGTTYDSSQGWPPTATIGLTKLEHFAGLAMQGYITRFPLGSMAGPTEVAEESVSLAKALLEELEKQK